MTARRARSARAREALAERAQAPEELRDVQRLALIAGLAGVGLSVIGALIDPTQFLRSYLVGFLFWNGITLGALAIAMLHHLTGGGWGIVVRRVLEAASRTLPLMAVAFVPILVGLPQLYLWARPEAVAVDPLLQHKAPYLNTTAFADRAILYFAILGTIAFLLNRWSLEQDRTADPALRRRMRLLSGPGLALWCLAVTFIAVVWLMSLDPLWFSSIYGVYLMGSQGLAALAFLILVAGHLATRPPLQGVIQSRHIGDYGNLMLAFLMLWGYFSVSQLIIIWSGNLPEEIPWYLSRLHGGWGKVGLVLVIGHFAVPFAFLLSRSIKTAPRALAGVALLVLAMRWVDLYWQAAPIFHPDGVHLSWLDPIPVVALGGLWVALFLRELGQRSLLPVNDPGLEEAMAHE
jgi:hypothetical protein